MPVDLGKWRCIPAGLTANGFDIYSFPFGIFEEANQDMDWKIRVTGESGAGNAGDCHKVRENGVCSLRL